jgi:hypothetical protein
LPKDVTQLFWDVDPQTVSWELHRDWIVGRVLSAGPWSTIVWLRKQLGDPALREWIVRREGRGLDARQLRFWQVILEIPEIIVDRWLNYQENQIWNQRVVR